jgi:hypothetical protein
LRKIGMPSICLECRETQEMPAIPTTEELIRDLPRQVDRLVEGLSWDSGQGEGGR